MHEDWERIARLRREGRGLLVGSATFCSGGLLWGIAAAMMQFGGVPVTNPAILVLFALAVVAVVAGVSIITRITRSGLQRDTDEPVDLSPCFPWWLAYPITPGEPSQAVTGHLRAPFFEA